MDNNTNFFCGPDFKFYWYEVTLAILLESKYQTILDNL